MTEDFTNWMTTVELAYDLEMEERWVTSRLHRRGYRSKYVGRVDKRRRHVYPPECLNLLHEIKQQEQEAEAQKQRASDQGLIGDAAPKMYTVGIMTGIVGVSRPWVEQRIARMNPPVTERVNSNGSVSQLYSSEVLDELLIQREEQLNSALDSKSSARQPKLSRHHIEIKQLSQWYFPICNPCNWGTVKGFDAAEARRRAEDHALSNS